MVSSKLEIFKNRLGKYLAGVISFLLGTGTGRWTE